MIARLDNLRTHPAVFRHLTGITVAVFDALAEVAAPAVGAAHRKGPDRPDRPWVDHVLATVVWLRQYPTQEVLGFLFGASDSTARRAVERCLPALAAAGRDTVRMPDPGRGKRNGLPAPPKGTPGLAVVIDSSERRAQRPTRRQRAYYPGKKEAHTLKTQVAVGEGSGRVVGVSDSVPGRWAGIKLLKASRLLNRLPGGGGGIGGLGYVGIGALHPAGRGASPRRKPRGKERPPEDRRYNRAFSRRRIVVGHGIGRLRRFAAVTHVNRHRRKGHATRGRAIAGLVNRMIDA